MADTQSRPPRPETESTRRAYAPPKLGHAASVRDLTRGGAGSFADFGGAMQRAPNP